MVKADQPVRRGDVYWVNHLVVEGESPAVYAQLLEELVAEYPPTGMVETGLVEPMASRPWRKARLVQVQVEAGMPSPMGSASTTPWFSSPTPPAAASRGSPPHAVA